MSLSSIFQRRGFWLVLFILFIAFPKDQAFASTWTDVLLSSASCKSDTSCTCWIEEVLVNTAHLYRVWKRCASNVVASAQRYVSVPGFSPGLSATVSCTTGDIICSGNCTGYSGSGTTYSIDQFCNGSLGPRYNEQPMQTGSTWGYISNPCLTSSTVGANCKSYDVLFAEFSSIVNTCQPIMFSMGTDGYGPYYGMDCSCIPERYQVVLYPYTDSFGTGCKMRSAMGDPILPIGDSDTPFQAGDGGSYNTEPSQGGGPDTDGDGIPDTTDPNCSGPGCTVTSPPTSTTNPDGTTTTTTTSTTHTGGGIAPTINTTTSTSGTGSTTPGSTTTTTSGPNGSSTSGCIDVNGDGLDDGSGIECSPQGRQFSAPSVSYDTVIEIPTEKDWGGLVTGFWTSNPLYAVLTGTGVQLSNAQCLFSVILWNRTINLDFCVWENTLVLIGYAVLGIAGVRSVFMAMGVD